MKWILALFGTLFATSAAAQAAQPQPATPSAVAPATVAPSAAPWDPVGPYITAGQDEPGYRSWYLAAPWRAAQVKALNDYFAAAEVAGIVTTWQLIRTATAWKDCGGEPFEVPPTSEWPHMVQTLRYIRDFVIPAVGPVEPVSVYRNPSLNVCAGGAPESAHVHYSAVDLVPLKPIDRVSMMRTLCGMHSQQGERYKAGLGFYAYLRFHIDTMKYRRWNMDPAVAAECPAIVHPEDAASIGQPLQPAPANPLAAPGVAAAPVTAPPPNPQQH
ncbi:MAG: hypothetical protein ACJ8FT_08550 [Sphingomonas sp.]